MGTLRRQAQKAERYRKYKAEVQRHRAVEGLAPLARAVAARTQLVGGRLGEARTELEDVARGVVDQGRARRRRARRAGGRGAPAGRRAGARLRARQPAAARREQDRVRAPRGRGARRADRRRAQRDRRDRGAARARRARSSTRAQRELAALEAEVERETAEVAAREAAAGEARQMLANAQGHLDEARARARDRGAPRSPPADAQLEALARRRDEASRRLERVMAETEQHTDAQPRSSSARAARSTARSPSCARPGSISAARAEGFEARRDVLADEVARGEAEVETLRTELHRRTLAPDVAQGDPGSLRGLRARHARGDAARRRDRASPVDAIRGVVADVVRAPELLEVAVEAALGDRLGGVLVHAARGRPRRDRLPQAGRRRAQRVRAAADGDAPGGRSRRPRRPNAAGARRPMRRAEAPRRRFEGEGGPATWMSPAWEPPVPRGDGRGRRPASRRPAAARSRSRTARRSSRRTRRSAARACSAGWPTSSTFADGYEQVGKRLLGAHGRRRRPRARARAAQAGRRAIGWSRSTAMSSTRTAWSRAARATRRARACWRRSARSAISRRSSARSSTTCPRR